MDEQLETLRRVCDDLGRLGVGHALVGGLAVGLRARPRATKDVDFAILVKDDNAAETLVVKLRQVGYRLAQLLEHKPTGRIATCRFFLGKAGGFEPDLDLLFASCGIEDEIVTHAEPREAIYSP